MTALPPAGTTVRVHIPGHAHAVDYVVLAEPAFVRDAVMAARPSRLHPGGFYGGKRTIPLEWIVQEAERPR